MENTNKILSVGEFNQYLSDFITSNFGTVWVKGELSNFKSYPSGHWYFKLKDESGQINGVMFRGRNASVDFTPRDGDQLEVAAQVNFYAPRGEINLNVQVMRKAGAGALFESFLKLKQKLEAEGLFDSLHKKPIPKIPRAIGIVTSTQAAALKDVLTTLARRASFIPIILYPSLVQGAEAPANLIKALQRAQDANEVDVILLVRGGGSIEDLWAFNDEKLARLIAKSPIPIISGVGHETDFTIADFVADLRAPTPTAAAELAAPDSLELLRTLDGLIDRIVRMARQRLDTEAQRIDHLLLRLNHSIPNPGQMRTQQTLLQNRLVRAVTEKLRSSNQQVTYFQSRLDAISPMKRLKAEQQVIEQYQQRIHLTMQSRYQSEFSKSQYLKMQLEALSPNRTLERGYSLVLENGKPVRNPEQLKAQQPYTIEMAQGSASVQFAEISSLSNKN
jgi:exodeoxyribonuclease VII large subunit